MKNVNEPIENPDCDRRVVAECLEQLCHRVLFTDLPIYSPPPPPIIDSKHRKIGKVLQANNLE